MTRTDRAGRARTRRRSLSSALLVGVLAVACGGTPDVIEWRNVRLDVPEGWVVVEVTDERVRLASAAAERAAETDGLVTLTLSFDPRVLPTDVRAALAARGATVESDGAITVGDEVPATRIVAFDPSVDPPTREAIVLVPSRGIVAVVGVLPGSGATDPAARLLEELDVALGVLAGASYGPPVLG